MTHPKPHWSFWLIAMLGTIWYLMGCANFIMQITSDSLSQYPETAQELIANRPLWAIFTALILRHPLKFG